VSVLKEKFGKTGLVLLGCGYEHVECCSVHCNMQDSTQLCWYIGTVNIVITLIYVFFHN
jgi:hypothetical protein